MRTSVSGLVVLLGILVAGSAAAQEPQPPSHAAPTAALDHALEQHVTATEADRAVVQRLLARPDVQALAAEVGLDVRHARNAVATLEGAQLADLAARARVAEEGLSGGQGSVRISTTLIIIALLVVILLIVAID